MPISEERIEGLGTKCMRFVAALRQLRSSGNRRVQAVSCVEQALLLIRLLLLPIRFPFVLWINPSWGSELGQVLFFTWPTTVR